MTQESEALVEEVARAIADEIGVGFDRAHKHKGHWVETRGEINGIYHDVNEPYQSDYLAAAKTIIPLIQAQVREESARIADEYHDWTYWGQDNNRIAAESAAREIAAAIRLGRPLTDEEIRKVSNGIDL